MAADIIIVFPEAVFTKICVKSLMFFTGSRESDPSFLNWKHPDVQEGGPCRDEASQSSWPSAGVRVSREDSNHTEWRKVSSPSWFLELETTAAPSIPVTPL